MKKIIYVLMLVLGMSVLLCSCEKEGGDGVSDEWIVGSWVLTGEEQIYWYWELKPNGRFIYYDLNGDWLHSYSEDDYATFSNGTLITPSNCSWEASLEGKYTLEGNEIIVDDIVLAKIERLGKDKARMTSTVLEDGIVERIKSFKTK